MSDVAVTAIHLEERGPIPNNARLPVLHYPAAISSDTVDLATTMEKRFERHGWPPQWRNGIYNFDHYHSKGHEVLGIAVGNAELVLGGDGGRPITVEARDVLLLPAGTGHRCLSHSSAFLVVGAYPPGQAADIVRDAPIAAMRQSIARLPFPLSDPVFGREGPMLRLWSDVGMAKA